MSGKALGANATGDSVTSERKFESPVAWLFGRQFIASLKWTLLYMAFKGKLDPRDWMAAKIIPAAQTQTKIDEFWRKWNEEWKATEDGLADSSKEFWFDYISDTGDGQRAVYSIAYLALSDLAVKKETPISDGNDVEFVLQPDRAQLEAEGKLLLPRGTFLFVGGDTSYHISDYATLANRFQTPFIWAYEDLANKERARSVLRKLPRLLFGIPGNHDYYDALDGFNRQFRRPSTGERVSAGERTPQLQLPTFRRSQEASYVALRLPFDWWFWGLDTENGEIDFRQWEFFNGIQKKYAPQKLIVATPEPTTVFGKYATAAENQSKTFAALKLERPFLKNSEPLSAGKCRLDLSGDVHHYSRHWGPGSDREDANRYASVMAGGGGAFFHPTHTDIEEVKPQRIHPPPDKSREKVAGELFKLWNIVRGGWVWLFGFIIAFSIFFAATFPHSSSDTIDSFPPFVWAGISPPLEQRDREPLPAFVEPMPRYIWGPNDPPVRPLPPESYGWTLSLILAPALLGVALFYSSKLFDKEYDPAVFYQEKPRREVRAGARITLGAIIALAFATLAYGLLSFHAFEINVRPLTRFGRSLIIMAALIWTVLAIIQSLKSSQWLFEEARHRYLAWWQYWPLWILMILSVLGFGSALWLFGKHESAFLISDLGLLLVLLLVGGGLIYFAVSTGGKLLKGAGKVGFLLLGATHALLQLSIPFLLIRKGHLLWAPLAMLVLVFIFKFIGKGLAKLKTGWPLALVGIAFGAALLSIPFLLDRPLGLPESRWLQLLLCFYAGAIGALMSCVLFGWYLAVSLAFNGHNNEAGGAARIEGFKQLVRIRLNREGLTGYVIAIDEPQTEGGTGKLRPRLVDVFHLCER